MFNIDSAFKGVIYVVDDFGDLEFAPARGVVITTHSFNDFRVGDGESLTGVMFGGKVWRVTDENELKGQLVGFNDIVVVNKQKVGYIGLGGYKDFQEVSLAVLVGWNPITLRQRWDEYAGRRLPPRFRVEDKVVYLDGALRKERYSDGIAFRLPDFARPVDNVSLLVPCSYKKHTVMDILPNGDVLFPMLAWRRVDFISLHATWRVD